MLRVVLIDDEQSVLTGLPYLLDWGNCGAEICGAYTSAVQAMNDIPVIKPDLVITDIEMPDISGLDLIAAIKELVPDSICAILTAFDDFKYAQQAVMLGAFRYLLKPLAPVMLAELLLDVQKAKSSSQSKDVPGQAAVRNFIVQDVIMNGTDLHYSSFLPYYTQFFQNTPLQLAIYYLLSSNAECINWIHDIESHINPLASFRNGSWYVFLLGGAENNLQIDRSWLPAGSDNVLYRLSPVFYGLENGHPIYASLTAELKANLFWGHPVASQDNPPIDINEMLESFKEQLLLLTFHSSDMTVDLLLSNLFQKISAMSSQLARNDVVSVYDGLLKCIYDVHFNICEHPVKQRTDLVALSSFQTLTEMHAYVEDHIRDALQEIDAALSLGHLKVISRAKTYIQDHYSDPEFRLTDISANMYLNYSYLSHLFRLETGNTMFKFLLDVRMQHAKELLEKSRFSISEISRKVGYSNPKNFHSAYKKYFGESPNAYQTRCLRNTVK